ncbi:MAG: hypothetical protein WC683_10090 [bacterium]
MNAKVAFFALLAMVNAVTFSGADDTTGHLLAGAAFAFCVLACIVHRERAKP